MSDDCSVVNSCLGEANSEAVTIAVGECCCCCCRKFNVDDRGELAAVVVAGW